MRRPVDVTNIQAIADGNGWLTQNHKLPLSWLHRRGLALRRGLATLNPYLGSLGLAAGAILLAIPVNLITHVSSLTRVFLVAVLISAVTYGLWPALFASLISIVLYDFFFLTPTYSLSISSPEDIINLCLFTITAVVVSVLAAKVRRHAVAADQRALTAEKLSEFARALAAVLTRDELAGAAAQHSARLLDAPVVVLLPEGDTLVQRAAHPPTTLPTAAASLAALDAWPRFLDTRGAGDRILAAGWHFQALRASGEPVGVIGLHIGPRGDGLSPGCAQLLDALTQQAGLAIERIALRQRLEDLRVKAETEQLRAALLTSISHDLRTPLTAIIGSAGSLRHRWQVLSDEPKLMLIGTIQDEAERLHRFIANLLDITRVEAGIVAPCNEAVQLSDVLNTALQRARDILANHRVETALPASLPLVRADAVLLGQAIFNVLDNAAKYTPPGSTIQVAAEAAGETVRLHIRDEGGGIPDADLERVFDKYYRIDAARRPHGGTGLGLAICRGFLASMNCSIAAANRPDRRGAMFSITLPALPHFELLEADVP
jgi:two-component system sensor histidine kinase KdpD